MILCDPITNTVYTDEATFPIAMAGGHGHLVELAPGVGDLHARLAGATALHYERDGRCAEDCRPWPCTTYQVLTVDLEFHAFLRQQVAANQGIPGR